MKIAPDIITPTQYDKLRTDVEQKTSFTLDKCELNVFETHKSVTDVRLTFGGFTITSMLRGKKVLKEQEGNKIKNYLPGESYILRPDSEMVIDFPEANAVNPTQCTALVLETGYLRRQLEYINEMFPRDKELSASWELSFERLWLQNDENIALLSNKLLRLFAGNDPLKDILVDLKLKELILSILRLQNFTGLNNGEPGFINERFRAVVEYIRRNITSSIHPAELSKMACMSKSVFYRTFANEFGVPPVRLILLEKIKHAKTMLASEHMQIKEVCFALGFSDPNYFSRAFKKIEGITPGEFQRRSKSREHN